MAISRKELNRIISSAHGQSSVGIDEVPRRDKLKQLSDARVAGWTDTLHAAYKAKLDWKAEKIRREEEQRMAQDAECAAEREVMRMNTLKNAEKLLQEQTEKIRQFRSQQMLVDTLHTRNEQLKEHDEKKRKESMNENLWHAAVVEHIQKVELEAKNETEKEKQRSLELALNLKSQREEREERLRVQQQRKRDEEAAIIQRIAIDELTADKAELEQKSERILKAKDAMEKNRMLLEKHQEDARRKEEEETRKCEEEVARQNRINVARANLEMKLAEKANSVRKLLSDRVSEQFKQRILKECEMLERDVRLRHEKEDKKDESTRKQIERERIAIDESRQNQLRWKLQEQQAEKKIAELRANDWARITREQQELECQKQIAKRMQNVELRNIQQQQIRENEERRAKDKAYAFEEEQQAIHKLQREDDVFKDFVTREINYFKAQGKRTDLLEKTLHPRCVVDCRRRQFITNLRNI
ncbi:hypothetical protein ACHAXH_008137 [Discostella pseudostelligera]